MASEGCSPFDQPCVLVVDDDARLMGFLFTVLTEGHFSIVAASDGQQAFDMLEHGLRPHVIVLDLMLPRVSGFDLLAHIRSDAQLRTIPMIVMTGSDENAAIGADVIFRKPFDHAELLAAIHRLIERDGRKAAERLGRSPPARDIGHEAPSR